MFRAARRGLPGGQERPEVSGYGRILRFVGGVGGVLPPVSYAPTSHPPPAGRATLLMLLAKGAASAIPRSTAGDVC